MVRFANHESVVTPLRRPLHVCHVVLSLRPGGLENGVVNVINGLDPREFGASVVCLQSAGEFAARIRHPDVPVISMGLMPGNDWGLVWRLARVFRRLRPDIAHTRNAEAFLYGVVAAKLARVPRVVHSEHGRTFPETRLRARVQCLLLMVVDYAFAVSARLRDDLVREIGVPAGRFAVVPNGVDLTMYKPSPARSLLAPESGTVIGVVGRLVAVKNYALLLRAVAQLPPALEWQLWIVGDGPEREALTTLAAELGIRERVIFYGHRDDVAKLLQRFDIFVLPSLSEGMSNTLLEAMATGVASIASRVGGNVELITDGLTGCLFESGDSGALRACVEQLLRNPELRDSLGRAAAVRAQQEFSILRMLERYAQMYRDVAKH
jgi:sugar transferase (PEP-CTERM/EpsH1 system associated)